MTEPLFFAPRHHEKVAGFKLPQNPKFWQSEIIRYLKSQHPYLPLDDSEIDIRRLDVTKGAAVGSVILGNQVAIPIIIQRPRPGADPELSPMDVFFYQGRYRFLDPEAIKSVIHTPQIGEPEATRNSRAFGGNPYIGDVTGDATPLEYSGQASPFAGPYDGAKVSMDLSADLLPEWMLKESGAAIEQAKERAALFGTTGAIGGAARGALTGKGGVQGRLMEAGKQALIGSLTGAVAGAGSVPVSRAIESKKRRRERGAIKRMVRRELAKESGFTVGLEAVLADGLLAGLVKNAYLDPNDISNFRRMLATNPHILQGSGGNLRLVEIVARRGAVTPSAAAGSIVKHPNIMQVYLRDGSLYIKFSGSPETRTSEHELKQALGDRFPEVMSRLKSGGVFMEHDGINQVTWDVRQPTSEARTVTRDGLYAVRTRSGENLVGLVCQAVMDLDGKTLPMKLFVSPEGKYALVKDMFGVRLADRHRLPSQVPGGGQSGVFVNYVHGTPISTVPLRLTSIRRLKPADGDSRVLYLVQEPMTGRRFTLSPVRGVQGFERMHVIENGVRALADGEVYYMPADSEWVSLKNPVRLAESAEELKKLSSVGDETHVTFAGGMYHVGEHGDLTAAGAREVLVAMGMDGDDVDGVVKQAHARDGYERGVRVVGLHAPQLQGHEVIEAPRPVYDRATIKFAADCRPGAELLKCAAESGHPETLDALLSLEFITPQNLRYFTDNVPDFEEAATRLAALLISIRLGMPHVQEQPVKDALEGLSKTVNKLRILKSAIDNKNERASTEM